MKTIFFKQALVVLFVPLLVTSCSLFKPKTEVSSATGWGYNNVSEGAFFTPPKNIEQVTGPGLVFVQGGMFVMGDIQEDVMSDWNSSPRRITVNSFYIDETEVPNIFYKEYLSWLSVVFDDPAYATINNLARPDSLVWREELSFNEPLVEHYFHHPSYNYFPVVGVTWKQAQDFCLWRSDRVNEKLLIQKGYLDKETIASIQGIGVEAFNTKSYILGEITPDPGKLAISLKNPFKNADGSPKERLSNDDGIMLPDYRLPTEAEWEYAAMAYKGGNYEPKTKAIKERGEELITSSHQFAWRNNRTGIRYKGNILSLEGAMQANFKRGDGDYMGISGGLNDNACPTAYIKSYFPNDFGVYNMSGNVSEWVADIYRPNSPQDGEDFNYFRGNVFTKMDLRSGKMERDSLGRIKNTSVLDAETKTRRNYQTNDLRNFLDGDVGSGVAYGYGTTTLIGDKTRVIKGGSWADMQYWLMPATRRYLEEDQSKSTIGFRCAMSRLGSQTQGAADGYDFSTKGKARRTGLF